MRPILALAMMTAAAYAETVSWGKSTATIGPCSDADACVTVINMLTGSPDELTRTLDMDGLQVLVMVSNGPGNAPDLVTLAAPRGFRVEPQSVTIEEGRSAVFKIFAPLLG